MRPGAGGGRGGGRARSGQRRSRNRARRPPCDRRGGAGRASPPHDQPGGERAASHTRRHADPHLDGRLRRSGPGVPAELAPTLFERFVRGTGDRGGSFGLGLAIVKAVAESHGGSVVLEPAEPSRGARFVVRLPARELVAVA
ncbi:MAG: ATP-binding protein [Actinobacteria bacterium]|nr:MAG: ATP-binding protein [Actinomycetota bacterium]